MEKELPMNWILIKVVDVSEIVRGITYQKSDASDTKFDNSCLVLRGGNIQDGKIVIEDDCVYVPDSIVKKDQKLRKGDVIIVGSTGSAKLIGKAAFSLSDEEEISFGAFLVMLRPDKKIESRYFDYFFLTEFYRTEIRELAGGININNIRREHLEGIDFPLPPLPEQQRIVAKLDTLFGHLDVLKTRLDRIPQLLKDFRQKVLTQAVTGKLTEEWREGRELEKWQDIILKDFTDIDVGPAFKSAEFEDSGIRLLRGENIEPGALRWNNTVYFPEEKLLKFSHLFIKEGNVILAMDRPIISTGLKLAKAKKEDLPCVLVQRVARFRPSEKLSSGFLYFLISSDSYIKHLFGEQTGTQIPHISSKQILSFNCILPPLEEQQEIVRRVESLFAKADRIEASYQKLKAKIEALPQALLAKAFRGELVEQLPTDLPAGSDGEFFAYVLYCSDGSLYKAFTNNLKRRYEDHKTGKGAEHTRKYMPLYVYHYEVFKSEAEAVKREKFFKSGHGRAWLKQMEKENRLRQAGGDARDLLEQIKRAKEGLQKGGKGKKYREDETELRMVADGKRKYGKR